MRQAAPFSAPFPALPCPALPPMGPAGEGIVWPSLLCLSLHTPIAQAEAWYRRRRGAAPVLQPISPAEVGRPGFIILSRGDLGVGGLSQPSLPHRVGVRMKGEAAGKTLDALSVGNR